MAVRAESYSTQGLSGITKLIAMFWFVYSIHLDPAILGSVYHLVYGVKQAGYLSY